MHIFRYSNCLLPMQVHHLSVHTLLLNIVKIDVIVVEGVESPGVKWGLPTLDMFAGGASVSSEHAVRLLQNVKHLRSAAATCYCRPWKQSLQPTAACACLCMVTDGMFATR